MIIVIIIIITFFLRFYNLNWDQGFSFNPDERNIAVAVSKIHFFDNLNPQFFAYGGFSIYLYRAAGEILALLTQNQNWVLEWGKINLIGRFSSAFFSTLTIIPLFFLAKNIFDKEAAWFAAVTYAFTVTSIQAAHFAVTESLLVLLITTLAYLSLQILHQPTLKLYLLSGIVLGLSIATKTTALTFSVLPLFAWTLGAARKISVLAALLGGAFLVFTLFSPYTFLNWDKFLESMRYETGVVKGTLSVPYTLQFTNTTPFIYQIKNLFWQMGPIAILSWLGLVLLVWKTFKEKNINYLFFLSFPLLYFLYISTLYAKFIRYMLPLIPFMVISAAYFLYYLKSRSRLLGQILILIFLALTIFWALSFFSIYTREQTRITASKWIYGNIPQRSYILGEHWDDGLPLPLNGQNPGQYKIEQLTIYDPETKEKLDYYAQKLSEADYIILNSRRLYGTLIKMPKKYPLTSKYYQLLFASKLGYEKVAEFSSYPQILGWKINDDLSEETLQVFDHPKAQIFKKTAQVSKEEYLKLLKL